VQNSERQDQCEIVQISLICRSNNIAQ